MCEPLTIAAAALAAGSVGANAIGASQRDAERSRVRQAEDQRQQQYQNQQTSQFNQTLNKVQKPATDQAVAQEADARTASDSALIDQGGNYVPVTGSAPQEVGSSIARATREALNRAKGQARRNANFSAVQGVSQKNNIELGRDAQWQQIFGDNQRRSAALLPGEMEEANRAGSGWRTAGQIMSTAATAAGMAGLYGGGPSWGDLFGAGGGPMVGSTPAAVAAPHGATQAPGVFRRWFS